MEGQLLTPTEIISTNSCLSQRRRALCVHISRVFSFCFGKTAKLVLMADGASTKHPQRPPTAAATLLNIPKTRRVVFIF